MSIDERYVIDARLGSGGMAEVFRARRIGVNDFARAVAVKRLIGGTSASSGFQELLAVEARITSRLIHPNIVSVLDFDRDVHGVPCLVMELVDGVDLARLARTGLLPFDVVTHVIIEALKGLGHAHRFHHDAIRGVVHRDVSPHNILLSWIGEVKVSDFGLAKARTRDAATATEGLKGKPAYMSPEQANSQPLDGRSDLFAVGTIMWELLVGRPLFGADDLRASLAAVLFGTVPRPRQLRAEVPRDLERIALKLLARERSDRYDSAEKAIADLLRCDSARQSDGSLRLATELALRSQRELPIGVRSAPRGEVGKRSLWPWTIGATLVATVVTIVAVVTRSPRKPAVSASTPSGSQAPYVALVEKRTKSIVEHLRFRLDAKELPPSCLLLLRWDVGNYRSTTLSQWAHEDSYGHLVKHHNELAMRVTDGDSIRTLDGWCRIEIMKLSTEPENVPPPLPFMGLVGPELPEPDHHYGEAIDFFESQVE